VSEGAHRASRTLSPTPQYRGRFAPSPTGPLHFGSLVAALASFADARAHGGAWLLRIEDLDPPREQPGGGDAILHTLERYGFEWDGETTWQSRRHAAYDEALSRLRAAGAVFPCRCTRARLAGLPRGAGGEPVYPGTCRGAPDAASGPHAWRLRVAEGRFAFEDLLQGSQTQDLQSEVGDFVLRRADGLWAYQLAVVVDDAAAGITHVVRGADLLSSTPRQIFLQRELALETPAYLHVPVAVNAAGEKLSKQTRARALPEDDPVPSLLAAWSFLEQLAPPERPSDAREFWEWAPSAWRRDRLPPVRWRPLPPGGVSGA
jgi:glutamyl-Q tRNA(Asp) synthetase